MRRLIIIALACSACSLALAGGSLPANDFFVENLGQWDGAFSFRYQGNEACYYLTATGMTIDLHQVDRDLRRGGSPEPPEISHRGRGDSGESPPRLVKGHVLRLSFLNANPNPALSGEDKLSSYSNYFLSRDSCKWRSRVGHYQRVIVRAVWPGIDVEYRNQETGVETVYHVHPFANPSLIQLRYEGQDAPLSVDANRCLQLQTSLGVATEQAPMAFQDIANHQAEVLCHYEITGEETCRLVLGQYDSTHEVVIDPLVYCSYWNGHANTEVHAMTADNQRNKIVTGETIGDYYFPLTPGAYCISADSYTGFISKFTPGGDTLLFSTFLGGGTQYSNCISADAQGAVYVAGAVFAQTLPLTPDAFDTTCSGASEGFVSRYSADGTRLEFSSYLGGSDRDEVLDIVLDSLGDVYLAGVTRSADFPVTPGALYPSYGNTYQNGFISIWQPETRTLAYSTYFPGQAVDLNALTVMSRSNVWVGGGVYLGGLPVTANAFQHEIRGGYDAFFAHLDLQSNSLLYCSYLGGSTPDTGIVEEQAYNIFPMSGDTVMICGTTLTPDFPVTPDAFDTTHAGTNYKAFVTLLSLPQTLVRSTLLGALANTQASYFALDAPGTCLATGIAHQPGFPVTPDAYDSSYHAMFLARMSHDLRHLEYGTYIGGSCQEDVFGLLVERGRRVWMAGRTCSEDLPTTPNALIPNYYAPGSDNLYGFLLCLETPDSGDVASPEAHVPQSLTLSAYPNPFNPSTVIRFSLPQTDRVRLKVYDILGQHVAVLEDGMMEAGSHAVLFDGSVLPSGVYFARLEAGKNVQTEKMVLLR